VPVPGHGEAYMIRVTKSKYERTKLAIHFGRKPGHTVRHLSHKEAYKLSGDLAKVLVRIGAYTEEDFVGE
jgi:hypothetical protein